MEVYRLSDEGFCNYNSDTLSEFFHVIVDDVSHYINNYNNYPCAYYCKENLFVSDESREYTWSQLQHYMNYLIEIIGVVHFNFNLDISVMALRSLLYFPTCYYCWISIYLQQLNLVNAATNVRQYTIVLQLIP